MLMELGYSLSSEEACPLDLVRYAQFADTPSHSHAAALCAPMPAPTVVLVHGLVIASAYMVPTAERLAPFCHVYVPDLPGYGKSYKPPLTLTLPRLTDALAEWLDALAIAKAHLWEILSAAKSSQNSLSAIRAKSTA